jgi:hypothetical protein
MQSIVNSTWGNGAGSTGLLLPRIKSKAVNPVTVQAVKTSRQQSRNRSKASCKSSVPGQRASSRSGRTTYVPVYANCSQGWERVRCTTKKLQRSAAATSANAFVTGIQSSGSAPSEPVHPLKSAWGTQPRTFSICTTCGGMAGMVLCIMASN